MDELAASKIFEFLRGGLPPQDGVAMWMSTEPGNDVSMSTSLRRRVLQYPTQLCWPLFHELFCKRDHLIQMP